MTNDQVQLIQCRIDAYGAAAGSAERFSYVLLKTGKAFTLHRSLLPRQLVRILRSSFRQGTPSIIYAPVGGADILVKNNIRLFCPDERDGAKGYSIKIGIPSPFAIGSLAREIKAHHLISAKLPVSTPIPRLLDYDRKNLRWMREELVIADKRVSAAQKADRFLQSIARELYQMSARSEPIGDSLRKIGVSLSEVQAVGDEAGRSISLNAERATWPVAMVHGDLSPGNMVASRDGRLLVVDWERCRVGPIAFDLRSMYKFNGERTLDSLRMVGGRSDVSPERQMQIAFALDLVLFRRNRTKWLTYFEERLGLTEAASRLHFERAAQDCLTGIAAVP